jgi:hypothetical protein
LLPEPTFGGLYEGPGVAPRLTVGPPYPFPWIDHAGTLVTLLGVALAVALVGTWSRARSDPAAALASGMVLISVAYPVVWVAARHLPVIYLMYDARFIGLLTLLPLLFGLALMLRAAALRRQ